MKKSILALLVLAVAGCTVFDNVSSAKRKELLKKYSVKNNVVYYQDQPFAELQAMTWSLDNGELVKEMNFKLIEKKDLELIGGMIDFLSDRHQGDEIEVEFEVEHNSQQFKL